MDRMRFTLPRFRAWALGLTLACSSATASAAEDWAPLGSEFLVNQSVAFSQEDPHVAADRDGNFTVTWMSLHDIFFRRYWKDGTPRGDETRVNLIVNFGEQDRPQIAMTPDGHFAITWEDWDGNDGHLMGIYARVYDLNAQPLGDEFLVNQFTSGSQFDPQIGMSANGTFVIAWSDAGRDGIAGVYARRFAKDGTALSDDFIVNLPSDRSQVDPSVAMTYDGRCVIAWTDASANFGEPRNVLARTYDASGVPLTSEFAINQHTDGMQRWPIVSIAHSGKFAAVWQDETGRDGFGKGVYARVMNFDGTPFTDEFRVNQVGNGDQSDPSLSTDVTGNLVALWTDSRNGDTDVYARRFDVHGQALGDEFEVHVDSSGDQSYGYVAFDETGELAFTVFQSRGDIWCRLYERTALDLTPLTGTGGGYQVDVCLPGNAGTDYLLAASSVGGGSHLLPGGFVWNLALDPIYLFSLGRVAGPLFWDFGGVLDSQAEAQARIRGLDFPSGVTLPIRISAIAVDFSDPQGHVIRAVTRSVEAVIDF